GGRGTGGGGRPANMPVIIGSIVAAAAVVVIIVIIVAMSGGGGSNDANGDHTTPPVTTTTSGEPTSTTGSDSIVKGDQSRTIDASQCTNAHNDLINPNKPNIVTMPNVQFLYVDSVVACFKAANWPYTIKHVDEQQWGQGTVTDQNPKYLGDYDPKSGKKITIWVSTGKGAS
ncbi:MAG: PASTA domain-containing protein, partial [Actinomycetia bacterium]|nr:PASTA domain-containing protein [Actinomycetes bacterium]